MSVLDQIQTARDPTFSARIVMAYFKVGVTAATEPANTPNHGNRLAYSKLLFKGQDNPRLIAAHVIASQSTIASQIDAAPLSLGSNINDTDLNAACVASYDARANAMV